MGMSASRDGGEAMVVRARVNKTRSDPLDTHGHHRRPRGVRRRRTLPAVIIEVEAAGHIGRRESTRLGRA